MQTSSIINIRTDKKVKTDAQKIASDLGFSLSTLINAYLRNFIRTKTVHFSDDLQLSPTPYLQKSIKKSEENYKKGVYVHFDNPQEAMAYLENVDTKLK